MAWQFLMSRHVCTSICVEDPHLFGVPPPTSSSVLLGEETPRHPPCGPEATLAAVPSTWYLVVLGGTEPQLHLIRTADHSEIERRVREELRDGFLRRLLDPCGYA